VTDPYASLADCARALDAGDVTSEGLTQAALDRITALDPRLHAFIRVLDAEALAAARQCDRERASGLGRGPLHGIPVALKDIIDVAGVPTTAHSRLMADHVATDDSGVAERLKAAGMVILGKLSLHEFARGAPTDELPWPNAINPWNPAHACGGSSSGAGVAVAAGLVAMAVGTDTGGSVRYPAACTGVVGLKPTYGTISRRGVFPLSFSLDHVGPVTRTVEDAALALQVLAGHDPGDPGSARLAQTDFTARLGEDVRGRRIGVARLYMGESGIDAETTAAVERAAQALAQLGAEVEDVVLPPRALFDAATWTLILAEGFAIHRDMLARRGADYGRTARERLSIGALVSGADVVQAQRHRRVLTEQMSAVLASYDAILCATAAGVPPPLAKVDDGPWRRTHPITAPFNLTGHPAIAVPAGFNEAGLPLSIQLVGKTFDEATLLSIAHAYEQAHDWHRKHPPIG